MGNLTTQLRHLATTALSGLFLAASGSFAEDAGNLYNTNFDINAGLRYFERQCSRCHGFDAKGNDETGAPDLTGRLARASSDVGIYNIIRTGIPGTAMLPVAADLPDAQVWQLVAYIGSLSTNPANIDLPGSVTGGARLFTDKGDCNSCHMIDGQGGRLGPDLSRIGEQRSPEELLSDMLNPHTDVAPRWWTMRVTDNNGTVREGLRMNEDSFSLRIMDEDSNLWSYPKNQIASFERLETSTMPSYTQTLSDSEVDDLVAYLFSLRKEN
ncbi:MAG: c-type cytochrome [Gammaproteobacteria bacterium]|jgi:putative heme-binding domain-containing protein|nr:c-type cytochrome [Gammaproteobacteria bacterium]